LKFFLKKPPDKAAVINASL